VAWRLRRWEGSTLKMSRLKLFSGRMLTLVPNRKYGSTKTVLQDVFQVQSASSLMRANAIFVWSYYWRFARLLGRRSRGRLYDQVQTFGEERLWEAIGNRHGAILLSVHLGDFDVAGAWLAARRQVEPVVVSPPLREWWRNYLFNFVRRRTGVLVRDARVTDSGVLSCDLARGRAVLVMLDRRSPGPTSASRMLDRPAVAPGGIAGLAVRSGASMVPAATWRAEDGSLVVWFGRPLAARDHAQATSFLADASQQLGGWIEAHPEQWHVPADLNQLSFSVMTGSVVDELGARGKLDPKLSAYAKTG
jgi:lauroyl/myristoyl acyltransferase